MCCIVVWLAHEGVSEHYTLSRANQTFEFTRMKKPLLFCLFVWIVLLLLPSTRGQTRLDWKGATIERWSGFHPAWAPLDPPFAPEKEDLLAYYPGAENPRSGEKPPAEVEANGLRVAPQFASVARNSDDRDVLLWCARSSSDSKVVARNFEALSRRFPRDVALLSWACGAQMNGLNLTTRKPGPLSSTLPYWSVQMPPRGSSSLEIDETPKTKAKWDALTAKARVGQRMEPRNGFWWWLETACLLGARRDEQVWNVLRVGKTKPFYDDHGAGVQRAIRRAHREVLGTIPLSFYLRDDSQRWQFLWRWRETTRQVSENVIGARFAGRHKVALEGGRDMVMMGAMMRRSTDRLPHLVGSSVEAIALQSALPASVSGVKRIVPGSSAKVFAGHPRSLLRYASEQNRPDIALQLTSEWNALAVARRAQKAKAKAAAAALSSSSRVEGIPDSVVALAAGTQNSGALLVQTLPLPLVLLGVLSLVNRVFPRRDERFVLPLWTRGLGWSALSLVVLIGAQVMLAYLALSYIEANFGTPSFWGLAFALPRLVALLPSWAFAFPMFVILVGALWASVIASRRARGDGSLLKRLRGLLQAPDERTGVLDLGPLLQLIALVGMWSAMILALAAWFYFPQQDALENNISETLHDQYANFVLCLFALPASLPAFLLGVRPFKTRLFLGSWREVVRRFLVAHLFLATLLYLLLSVGGAVFDARFEAQWERANAPVSGSNHS